MEVPKTEASKHRRMSAIELTKGALRTVKKEGEEKVRPILWFAVYQTLGSYFLKYIYVYDFQTLAVDSFICT